MARSPLCALPSVYQPDSGSWIQPPIAQIARIQKSRDGKPCPLPSPAGGRAGPTCLPSHLYNPCNRWLERLFLELERFKQPCGRLGFGEHTRPRVWRLAPPPVAPILCWLRHFLNCSNVQKSVVVANVHSATAGIDYWRLSAQPGRSEHTAQFAILNAQCSIFNECGLPLWFRLRRLGEYPPWPASRMVAVHFIPG